ncbi:MAG: hypothetical protein QOI68_2678, partial [Pseudonocardiales bacterium]|nr:hypothetical protein [Pseudonocardiales bacterium]
MSRQHRVRRAALAMVAVAAVACATLGVLAGLGVWKPQGSFVGSWSAATNPLANTVPNPADSFTSDVG